MQHKQIGTVPNFTTPALIMAGVNLTWIFIALWALLGFLPVLLLALGLNRGVSWLARRRGV